MISDIVSMYFVTLNRSRVNISFFGELFFSFSWALSLLTTVEMLVIELMLHLRIKNGARYLLHFKRSHGPHGYNNHHIKARFNFFFFLDCQKTMTSWIKSDYVISCSSFHEIRPSYLTFS